MLPQRWRDGLTRAAASPEPRGRALQIVDNLHPQGV